MAARLMASIGRERLRRLDVNFSMPEKNLDTFIGRAAHIQFLECQVLMQMLVSRFGFFFEAQT